MLPTTVPEQCRTCSSRRCIGQKVYHAGTPLHATGKTLACQQVMPEGIFCIWMELKYLFFKFNDYIGNELFTESIKMKHLNVSPSQT